MRLGGQIMKYVIMVGNVIDGLSFIGPFDSRAEAAEYAKGLIEDWLVAPVEEPDSDAEWHEQKGL